MIQKIKNLRIYQKFILANIIVLIPLFVISHIINISTINKKFNLIAKNQKNDASQKLKQKGIYLAHTFSKISATPMMSNDLYTIQTYSDELIKESNIGFIAFINQHGDTISRAGKNNGSLTFFKDSIITDKKKLGVAMNVGTIILGVSDKNLKNALLKVTKDMNQIASSTSKGIAISNTILFIFIIVLSLLLVEFLINRPIKRIKNRANKIANEITNGDLNENINNNDIELEFIPILEGIEEIVNEFKKPLMLSLETIDKLANGEELEIKNYNFKGEFKILENNIIKLSNITKKFKDEIDFLIKNAENGNLNKRADKSSMKGNWEKMIIGLNKNIDILLEPVNESLLVLENLATNNLTQLIEKNFKGDNDKLKINLNKAIVNFRTIIKKINDFTISLNDETKQIQSTSNKIIDNTESITQETNNVSELTDNLNLKISTFASAIEEVNINTNNISTDAADMANKMETVLTSIKELSASINEITTNSEDASKISKKTTEESQKTNEKIIFLSKSANEIGAVTDVIKKIAEQTNLLALNATIEAASAGEAGKGFAVVANEIKELANQSAKAAEDIASKIALVQTTTKDSVEAIENVDKLITQIDSKLYDVLQLVENQNKFSENIANNMDQSYQFSENIANNITDISTAINEIASNISDLANASNEIADNTSSIKTNTNNNLDETKGINVNIEKLTNISDQLNSIISKFKV